jgi:hypothetical protein
MLRGPSDFKKQNVFKIDFEHVLQTRAKNNRLFFIRSEL